jgi:hypothetical protein
VEAFAAVLVFAFCPGLPDGSWEGVRAGNRPAALPPGLSVGLTVVPGRYGRLLAGIGEVLVMGALVLLVLAAVALTATVADATGSLDKCAALPVTVSRTDITVEAAAMATCASSWRWDDFTSTAPRSQDEVPSWLPQPKLNSGVTLAGEAVSRTVASGRLPPRVQALTAHWADCPRLMAACKRCTATQRLTCVVCVAIATADPEPGPKHSGCRASCWP